MRLAEVLRAAGLDAAPVQRLGPEPPYMWLTEVDPLPVVLRRYESYQSEADVRWEHEFLSKMAQTAFPAPRPVPLFSGRSWVSISRALWGTMTYISGRPLLWELFPDISAAGAFLAEYHSAADACDVDWDRPTAVPLAQLNELVEWPKVKASLKQAERFHRFQALFDELLSELDAMGYEEMDRTLVHGDFTTDNLIVDGEPPRIVGAIDFGFSFHDARIADIGFALWRSGRAGPRDVPLDLERVRRFTLGYHRCRPLSVEEARAIPS